MEREDLDFLRLAILRWCDAKHLLELGGEVARGDKTDTVGDLIDG